MKSDSKYIFLILIHAFIGIAIFSFKPFSKFYFIIVTLFFIGSVIVAPKHKKTASILNACAYFVGAEVLFRMTKGGIVYEASKYLVIVFVLMGMFFKGISGKGYPYFIYLILLVPSILVAAINININIDANFRTGVAFVLSGPVCLGLASLFFYDRKVKNAELMDMLAYVSLPVVSMAFYLSFYSPSIKESIKNTASNFTASGGFGPNQVATILGLGMFALTVRLLMKSPNLFLKLFNSFFLILLTYRAIITFSRGGVVAAILMIMAFLVIVYSRALPRLRNKLLGSFVLFVSCLAITWIISSNTTGGMIDKRYANQDSLGRDKEDLSTGRAELIVDELYGFFENPFLGIGASHSKYRGTDNHIIVSHNEISRLLSEHGIIGVLILLILIFTPLSYRSVNRKNIFFFAFLAFWFATVNHSALRLAGPAFFYALALINIENEKRPIHRKRLS